MTFPIDRRHALLGIAATAVAGRASAGTITLPFGNGERPLVRYPGKRPMIGLTARPPQLETPFAVFREGAITPNDAFFVRYHMSGVPYEIDMSAWRLNVGGHVGTPLALSLADLRQDFPTREIVAVNQCSGNSRGFSEPRVAGGQLGHGAMGNARWTGVALRDVLDRAGVRAGAVDVTFNGLDTPPVEEIGDYVKALGIDHARDDEVMLAWAMNGEPLPFLNGFPLRLVVPGHFGTYWVKHLSDIFVTNAPFTGPWMASAYRIPDNDCACVPPGSKPEKTRPIGRFVLRSFITSHEGGARITADAATEVKGIAFDGGSGIRRVMLSTDSGASWREARLGPDLGRYSFREWRLPVRLPKGEHVLMARAWSNTDEQQPLAQSWNPAGYLRNVVEKVKVTAA